MKLFTKNKRAYFDYDIIDTYDAGIVLLGHEVKSIKTGHLNINDAIIKLHNRDIEIINMDIPLYERTSPIIAKNYVARAPRKLLLNAKERTKIVAKTTKTGYSIVPLEVRGTKTGILKIKIGIGGRKKNIEKKRLIKEREGEREVRRELKHSI